MIDKITEEYVIAYLDHIIGEFQIRDLVRASWDAKANFLVAVGCMNTIEFLGGIDNGLLGKRNKVWERFRDGVRLLQGEYINPPNCNEEILYELRNSLTHQYLVAIKKVYIRHIVIVSDWETKQAIFRDIDEFTLNVAQVIQDLGMAWAKLRTNLEKDNAKLVRVSTLLNALPILQ